MNVYQKLQQARIILQSKEMKKSGKNSFANYQYFELSDFLPTINQIFNDVGLCGCVSFETDMAFLTIFNVEDPADRVTFSSPMASAQLKGCHEVQNLGATQTYLRRYLWVMAMEIVEHDAVDSTPLDVKKEKLPTLSDEEAQYEYDAWIQFKASVEQDADKVAAAWKEKPSNVRSAIKSIGDSLQQEQK